MWHLGMLKHAETNRKQLDIGLVKLLLLDWIGRYLLLVKTVLSECQQSFKSQKSTIHVPEIR